MDQTPDSSAPVHVASLPELRDWLAGNGVPVHRWGDGPAKRVEDLWSELVAGESVLVSPPPERRVSFVSVVIKKGDKRLAEIAQLLATGEIRQRRQPPAEKLLPGEDVEMAAYRCVEEELGVPRESCRIVPGTRTDEVRNGESPSYPGLMTRYSAHQVDMEVPNLPDTAFPTLESAGSEDAAVTEHSWDWI